MSIPCETELLLRIKENARLQAELSAALSLSLAYREALEAIKEHLEICAAPKKCPEIKAAFEAILDREPEVKEVTREEINDFLDIGMEVKTVYLGYSLADHLLIKFRVERR